MPDFYAVVAALLALILLVDISALWLTGRQVPELLGQLIFGVFGFYFGRAPGSGSRGRGDRSASPLRPDSEQAGRAGQDGQVGETEGGEDGQRHVLAQPRAET